MRRSRRTAPMAWLQTKPRLALDDLTINIRTHLREQGSDPIILLVVVLDPAQNVVLLLLRDLRAEETGGVRAGESREEG